MDENGYLLYRYRGTDPQHHENRWLRQVRDRALPLLYLAGVAKGRYLPSAAAIIEDHPESLTFGVQLMPIDAAAIGTVYAVALDPATRRHYLALVQRRTGQARFRETVLDAYASRCTLRRLRHRELLNVAHIVSYAKGGTHQVPNGLAFCKIHHAAYDSDIVGVRPDGVAEVRRDVLEETDGAHAATRAAGGAQCPVAAAPVAGVAAVGGGVGETVGEIHHVRGRILESSIAIVARGRYT